MPTTTPRLALRIPADTDKVADTALHVRNLAADVEAKLWAPVDRNGLLAATGNIAAGATVDTSANLAAMPAVAGVLLVVARVDLRQNTLTTAAGSVDVSLLLGGSTKDTVTVVAPPTPAASVSRHSECLIGQLAVAAGATPQILVRCVNAAGSGIAINNGVRYQALWYPS